MSKTHLVIPDSHATPGKSNRRAEWVGRLINEVKPDVVINLGDSADMPSLCSYDHGKKSFIGRTYAKDIEVHGDFQERLWNTVRKSKRKLPRRITLIGNHEQRIDRAIETQPELEGVIGYSDLCLGDFYDDVVHYEGSTPGSIEVDGITYAHYLVSGISGRPISGEHHAYSLLAKKFSSCVVGHAHTLDWCVRTRQNGKKISGLVAGCYQEHTSDFAGEANKLWWRGVCILRNVEDGVYDLETVSLDYLKKNYS
mgnify:CR=1 FL=1